MPSSQKVNLQFMGNFTKKRKGKSQEDRKKKKATLINKFIQKLVFNIMFQIEPVNNIGILLIILYYLDFQRISTHSPPLDSV